MGDIRPIEYERKLTRRSVPLISRASPPHRFGIEHRKTIAMKDTNRQVRLAGCGAVLADPSGQDYYVVTYGDNAWGQLLAQRNALQDRTDATPRSDGAATGGSPRAVLPRATESQARTQVELTEG